MLVLGLSKVPWHVSEHIISNRDSANASKCNLCFPLRYSPVLDHTLNLPPHGQKHQNQPIHHQHWPEHRQVEYLGPATQEAQHYRPCRGMPELELGESANERLEFLVVLGGERGLACGHTIFHVGVCVEGGVEFRGDKCEEEVEEVDA